MTAAEAIQRVKPKHVYAALRRIDRGDHGYDLKKRQSTKYCLKKGNQHYPPKCVLSLAVEEATGTLLGKSHGHEFYGGSQTNNPLRNLGFIVVECRNAREHAFPSSTKKGADGPGRPFPPFADGYLRATKAQLKYIEPEHNKLALRFYKWLQEKGYGEIEFEKSRVDIEFKEDGQLCRAELKVCRSLSTTKALREALGQLLEYNFYGERKQASRWYVVLDSKPSKEDREYVDRLRRSELRLPLMLCWQDGMGFAHT